MTERFANEYRTVLDGSIDASQTTLVVDSDTGAPDPNFRLRIDDEYILVTAVSGLTYTVERGIEGSTGATHPDNADVFHVLTNEGLETAMVESVLDATGRTHAMVRDECFFNATTNIFEGGIAGVVSGTSAALANGSNAARHPGVISLGTGSTSTGRAALATLFNTVEYDDDMKSEYFSALMVPTLSDGTNRFTVRAGIGNIGTGDGGGYYFRYIDNVNSGKWQCVLRLSGGTETSTDSGVTVDTGWHTFRIEVPYDSVPVKFYIDDTLVATVATTTHNIIVQSGTVFLSMVPLCIVKSVGNTARSAEIDIYRYSWEYRTPR